MKKISFILLVSIICSCFSLYALTFADEASVEVAPEAIGLLSELGIVLVPESEAEYLEIVTRADFAVYVASMLRLNEYGSSDTRYYTDVPMDHWGLSAINVLTERGILCGYNGRFNPDEPVTIEQAVKVFANALGYKVDTEFPMTNDYKISKLRNNLLVGVNTSSNTLVFGDAVTMIYNALCENVMTPYIISEGYFVSDADQTLLEVIYDIYTVKGVVTEVCGVSIDAKASGDIETIRIGDERFDSELEENLNQYLGREVLAFYFKNDEAGIKDIILMFNKHDASKEIIIDIDDLSGINPELRRISYSDAKSGRAKSVSYSPKTVAIKNGKNVTAKLAESVKSLTKGTIELVWSDSHSALIIREYYNVATAFINSDIMQVYDEFNKDYTTDFMPQEGVYKRIWNSDGKRMNFSEIAVGDIISVYASEEYIDAYVSKKTLSGKVTNVKTEGSKKFLMVDSVYYEIDTDFSSLAKGKSIKSGKDVTLYYDVWGKIANVADISIDDFSYGYIVNSKIESDGFSEKLKLRILTINNKLEVFEAVERMRIDGKTEDDGQKQQESLKNFNGRADNLVVRYKLNDKGLIAEIDTPYPSDKEDKNKTLTRSYTKASTRYSTNSMNMGPLVLLGTDTVYFNVPSDENIAKAKDSDYLRIDKSVFVNSTDYNVEAYQIDEESGLTDVLLAFDHFSSSEGKTQTSSLFLVESLITRYDEEKGAVTAIAGMAEGVKVEYPVFEGVSADMFEPGDLFMLKLNVDKNVTGSESEFYDFKSKNKTTGGSWTGHDIRYGYPLYFKDNVLTLSNTLGGSPAQIVDITGVPITVCDARGYEPVYRAGSETDIADAKNTGGLVFVGRLWTQPRSIVVYLGIKP